MSNTIRWGTLAVGTLALTFTLSVGNTGSLPPKSQDQAAGTQTPASVQTRIAAAARVSDRDANARVDPGNRKQSLNTSPEMLQRAQALRAADRAATRVQGPAETCLVQMKTVFCPIIGNMPFIRDIAGQVAMWGHFDCPTGTPPKS